MFFKSSVFRPKIQENIQKKLAVSLKENQHTGISQNRNSASQLASQPISLNFIKSANAFKKYKISRRTTLKIQ